MCFSIQQSCRNEAVLVASPAYMTPRPPAGRDRAQLAQPWPDGSAWSSGLSTAQTPLPNPRRGSYQNKCPHILMTASLAVSRQMLHSKLARSRSRSRSLAPLTPPPLLLPLGSSPPLLPAAVNAEPAGPPPLEDRGPAAAIMFTVQVRKLATRHSPSQANISSGKSSKCHESEWCCRATWRQLPLPGSAEPAS